MTDQPRTVPDMSMLLQFEVMAAFHEEQACEHSEHGNAHFAHSGKAEYYAIVECPRCGSETTGIRALCGKFVNFVEKGGLITCARGTHPCGAPSTGWKFIVKERIGK